MMEFVIARILFLLEIVQLVLCVFFAWWGFNLIMVVLTCGRWGQGECGDWDEEVGAYKDDDEGQR